MFGTKLVVEPDYTISAEEAYTNTTMSYIEETKGLAILDTVDHEVEPSPARLASWVTDWDADARCPLQGWPTLAAPVIHPSISFRKSAGKRILVVQGFVVDAVDKLSNMLHAKDIPVGNMTTEQKKGTPFLLDHIWSVLDLRGDSDIRVCQNLDHLSLILAAGYHRQQPASNDMMSHRADFFAYLSKFESIRTDRTGDVVKSLSAELKSEYEAMAATGSASQYIQDITHGCMGRRVFGTAAGSIGRGPRTMKKGDLCCVVLGSSMPLVLRMISGGYVFLGTAILHGWNNHEAIQSWRDGKLSLTEFSIF
jgi:hypothetical protein